jgi:hypothetical protein
VCSKRTGEFGPCLPLRFKKTSIVAGKASLADHSGSAISVKVRVHCGRSATSVQGLC